MVPIAMAVERLKSQTTICRFNAIRVKGVAAEMRFLLFYLPKLPFQLERRELIK